MPNWYWSTHFGFFSSKVNKLLITSITIDEFRYRRINFKIYIIIVIAICSAYSFLTIQKAYTFMAERPYAMVTCLIIEAMPGEAGDFWFQTAIMINLLTILLYLAVWIILRFKTSKFKLNAK